mgnify:CR=1 FL=1
MVSSSLLVVIFPGIDANRAIWMVVKLSILPLIVGIGYEFIKYAGKHDNVVVRFFSAPVLLMQRLTTQEPTDDIIEVGIESIKAVLYGMPEKAQEEESVDSADIVADENADAEEQEN